MKAIHENARRQPGAAFDTARAGIRTAQDTAAPRVGIDGLLSRLERVQRGGHGWRADCPRGHGSRGTLSVAQGDDGRILLHCFSGCSTADVLATMGLSMTDVMPERIRNESPDARRMARARFRLASVTAAAGVIEREARIALIAACDLLHGEALPPDDVQRLCEAVERIASAREALA